MARASRARGYAAGLAATPGSATAAAGASEPPARRSRRQAARNEQADRIATAGLPRPRGWHLSAAQRVAAGYALGALRLHPAGGPRLLVAQGAHGRALLAAEPIAKGAYVCSLSGRPCVGDPADERYEGREKLYISAARNGRGSAKFLLLHRPSAAEPGNLCNTAAGGRPNNARLARQNGSSVVRVYATRAIAAGDEILVPYGAGYTRELRQRSCEAAAEQPRRGGSLLQRERCPRCHKSMFPEPFARHTRLNNCRRRVG